MKYIVNIIMIFTILLFTSCADVGEDQNKVTPNPPVAKIIVRSSEINFGESITLSAIESSDVNGNIVSYAWLNENNTTLSENKEFSYKFSTAGEHTITLKVTDNEGLVGTTMKTVMVKAVLTSVTLELSNTTLKINDTTQAKVTAHYNDNSSKELINTITWIISNKAVVSIDDKLEVKALSSGTSTIQAKVEEISSSAVSLEVLSTDTTPPVITLNGDNNITLTVGNTYTELGATALDDVDGNVSVTVSGSVDTAMVGTYVITYSAKDSSNNKSTKIRTVIIKASNHVLKTLMLTATETSFIRKKDIFSKDYSTVKDPLTVMATYSNGNTEEVTDQVKWTRSSNDIRIYLDYFTAKKGDFIINASLDNITSNDLKIHVEDEEEKLLRVEKSIDGREATVSIALSKKPLSDVKIKLKLNKADKVRFRYSDKALEQEFIVTPKKFNESMDVFIVKLDSNDTSSYTITTEPFVSDDPYYEEKNPKDIVVNYDVTPKLIPPSLQDRRGAIRGVPIRFRVTSKNINLNYNLINPPEGMEIIGRSDFGEFAIGHLDGVDIKWDVPFDIEEKTYQIKVEGVDEFGQKGEITFDIKVPKTDVVATKIINNELIVTDVSSSFYGMKMKSSNGDDISSLTLRSVSYADVWKKGRKKRKNHEYNILIIDNMPKKLDIKLPEKIDTYAKRIKNHGDFYRYTEHILGKVNFPFWDWEDGKSYMYEGTNGIRIPHKINEFNSDGSKVLIFIFENTEK